MYAQQLQQPLYSKALALRRATALSLVRSLHCQGPQCTAEHLTSTVAFYVSHRSVVEYHNTPRSVALRLSMSSVPMHCGASRCATPLSRVIMYRGASHCATSLSSVPMHHGASYSPTPSVECPRTPRSAAPRELGSHKGQSIDRRNNTTPSTGSPHKCLLLMGRMSTCACRLVGQVSTANGPSTGTARLFSSAPCVSSARSFSL